MPVKNVLPISEKSVVAAVLHVRTSNIWKGQKCCFKHQTEVDSFFLAGWLKTECLLWDLLHCFRLLPAHLTVRVDKEGFQKRNQAWDSFEGSHYRTCVCLFACIMSVQLDSSAVLLQQLLCKQPLPSVSYSEAGLRGLAIWLNFTKPILVNLTSPLNWTGKTLCAHLQSISLFYTHTHNRPPLMECVRFDFAALCWVTQRLAPPKIAASQPPNSPPP